MPATITFAARPTVMAAEAGQQLTLAQRQAIRQWARSAARFFELVTSLAQFDPKDDSLGPVNMAAAASLLTKIEDLSAGVPRDGVPEARLQPEGGTLNLTDPELVLIKRAWLRRRPSIGWGRAREIEEIDTFLAGVVLPAPVAP